MRISLLIVCAALLATSGCGSDDSRRSTNTNSDTGTYNNNGRTNYPDNHSNMPPPGR